MNMIGRHLFGGGIGPVILEYHRVADLAVDPWGLAVTPQRFADQMAYLRRRRTPLAMAEFVARHAKGTLPVDAVAITFDDGYLDNLVNAKPILQAENIPVTLFVVTGLLERAPTSFWWDELTRLILANPSACDDAIDVAGTSVPLTWDADPDPGHAPAWFGWQPPRTARQAAYAALWSRLRLLTEEQRAQCMKWLRAQLGPVEATGDLSMTEAQLHSFREGGLTELGGHTVTHPTLPSLNPERRRYEIEGCRDRLAQLGIRPEGFAYPFGDMNENVRGEVKRAGFAWACCSRNARLKRGGDRFALPRLTVGNWNERQLERHMEAVR